MISSIQEMPILIATSVVRGSQQGESHGGVYLIDFARREVRQTVDWNTVDIDFTGRGWDRGLRGIEFDASDIYIAASDELFVFDRSFRIQRSFRCRYLKHCHEIFRRERLLFLTSTGYDSLLAFDLDRQAYIWGLHVSREGDRWVGRGYDPQSEQGPPFANQLHINSVYCDDRGVFVSGLRTGGLLHVGAKNRITTTVEMPQGIHNARPFRDGIVFNDTNADHVRYVARDGRERAFPVPAYDPAELLFGGVDDSKIARPGFGRGLCPITQRLIAAGSSPSTVSIYDIDSGQRVAAVNLTLDVRNAIHGLEVWPY